MPLILIVRFLFSLASLGILALAGYLLWSWYVGELVQLADGAIIREREAWLLWVALGLFALSFLGRPVILFLLAKRDSDPTSPDRSDGSIIRGETGSSLYVEKLGDPASPPIILVHGWGMDSTIWFYAKRDLARDFRVL